MSAEISRWDLPSVSGKAIQARRPGKTVSELEDVERRAYEEAFAKGREAGVAAAKVEHAHILAQAQAQVNRLQGLLKGVCEIWVGGSAAAAEDSPLRRTGARVIESVDEFHQGILLLREG